MRAAPWLVLIVGVAGAVPAQDVDPETWLPDEALAPEVAAELVPTLAEPSPEDRPRGRVIVDGRWRPGRWSWRVSTDTSSGVLRLRWDDLGRRCGGVLAGAEGARLGAGRLRLDHGCGLIAFGAGRWRALDPLQGLLRPREGIAPYAGADPGRAVEGFALVLDAGARLRALAGRLEEEPGTKVRAAAAALGGNESEVSLLALDVDGWRGGAAGLRARRGDVRFAAEIALARSAPGEGTTAAACAVASWRPARRWVLEAAASGGGDPKSPLGERPPLAAGDDGRGAAVRLVAPLTRGWRGGVMVWRGDGRSFDDGGPRRRRRDRTAAVVRGRLGLWEVRARMVRDRERTWSWEDTPSWGPAALVVDRTHWTLGLDLRAATPHEPLAVLRLRRRSEAGGDEVGRGLLRLGLRVASGPWGEARLDRTVVWGGALDLMTVEVPARGAAVLRHVRYLRRVTTLGWSATRGSLHAALVLETLLADDVTRDFGVRIRIWWRGHAF